MEPVIALVLILLIQIATSPLQVAFARYGHDAYLEVIEGRNRFSALLPGSFRRALSSATPISSSPQIPDSFFYLEFFGIIFPAVLIFLFSTRLPRLSILTILAFALVVTLLALSPSYLESLDATGPEAVASTAAETLKTDIAQLALHAVLDFLFVICILKTAYGLIKLIIG